MLLISSLQTKTNVVAYFQTLIVFHLEMDAFLLIHHATGQLKDYILKGFKYSAYIYKYISTVHDKSMIKIQRQWLK